jgi:hypothetical protein
MDRWKSRDGKSQRGEEKKKIKKRKSKKKEDAGGRKVAIHCVFPLFVAPEGRKVGVARSDALDVSRSESLTGNRQEVGYIAALPEKSNLSLKQQTVSGNQR